MAHDNALKKQRQLRGGDTINVFTVASGHMYERLQNIMILSVLRHTKSRRVWMSVIQSVRVGSLVVRRVHSQYIGGYWLLSCIRYGRITVLRA